MGTVTETIDDLQFGLKDMEMRHWQNYFFISDTLASYYYIQDEF